MGYPPRSLPRPWSRPSSTSWRRSGPGTTSRSASSMTSRTPRCPATTPWTSSRTTWCARCSLDWGPTARSGGVFLLNAPYGPEEVWGRLPREVQEQIIARRLQFYVIDALQVARDTGMGGRINTIMQTCFFAVSGVLPREQAIARIKKAIKKTYSKKGDEVVRRNFEAVDQTLANLHEVPVPAAATSRFHKRPDVPENA